MLFKILSNIYTFKSKINKTDTVDIYFCVIIDINFTLDRVLHFK